MKIIVTTSYDHLETLSIYEASHECVWIRSMIQHIWESVDYPLSKLMLFVLHKL